MLSDIGDGHAAEVFFTAKQNADAGDV